MNPVWVVLGDDEVFDSVWASEDDAHKYVADHECPLGSIKWTVIQAKVMRADSE